MFHRQTRTTHINNIGTQLIIPLHCGTKKCRIIARLCTERTSTLCHFGWAAPRSNREIQQYKKTQYKGIHLEDDKRRKSRYMTNGHDWVSRNRQEQNRLFWVGRGGASVRRVRLRPLRFGPLLRSPCCCAEKLQVWSTAALIFLAVHASVSIFIL